MTDINRFIASWKSVVFSFLIFTLSLHAQSQPVAFPGAEGFGAYAVGGRGGDVYHVTTLADSGEGSLRHGIESASAARTIVFDTSGTIILNSILWIRNPYITIAGQTAPGDGICIRDYSLNIKNTHDIIIRYIRIRRGDVQVLANGVPTGSTGLDAVSIDDSKNIIFDHVSLSWSCDEIFGIVQNENVSIQWCLLAEPLGDPLLHPYGTSHAYGMNNSATTLSIHHCLMANYVMRGPEFEPNDADSSQGYNVLMESVNNILFDYKKSGSRYKTGIEDNPEAAAGINFRFHFLNNYYIRKQSSSAPEIHAVTKLGFTDQLKVHVDGNIGPNRTDDNQNPWLSVYEENGPNILSADSVVQAQMSDSLLFSVPVPVSMESAVDAYQRVIKDAGCNLQRDSVDMRIISNVVNRKFYDYLHSQQVVGGWPVLKSAPAQVDTDRDGMPDWWEDEKGHDKFNPEDRNATPGLDGYTNLENYLNGEILVSGIREKIIPEDFTFRLTNYPNPFNADTRIIYRIPFRSAVNISLYSLTGQKVTELVNSLHTAGTYEVALSGAKLASGTYILKLDANDRVASRKILLLK
ncbi:MAG: T9SS type A sorting domain-containing protein [Calditrichales bacterium]|nr:MAG: T9SS type A sorting domain-containing protein [Calditrichales bacterium]